LWGRVQEILLLNKFFFQLSMRALLAKTKSSQLRHVSTIGTKTC